MFLLVPVALACLVDHTFLLGLPFRVRLVCPGRDDPAAGGHCLLLVRSTGTRARPYCPAPRIALLGGERCYY